MNGIARTLAAGLVAALLSTTAFAQDIAVRGQQVWTMGPQGVIENGVVVIEDGTITAVGPAASTAIPTGMQVLEAPVVTPGLVDAHSTVGLTGYLNQPDDQDQLDTTAPVQPHLRAIDAYNPHDRLVEWVRELGITTLHTGHGPGALVSGQTMVVKTVGNTVDAALVEDGTMVVANLGTWALDRESSPGTRAKQMAMLRQALVSARSGDEVDVGEDEDGDDDEVEGARDLVSEAFRSVVRKERPLLITAHRSQDIQSALRLAEEFDFDLVLDGAADAHMMLDEIREAGVPVILHPTMARNEGELENAAFTTAAVLAEAGIPFALQSGYEAYVPKTRVVLWEAGFAAGNGLAREDALASITIDAARIIGMEDRVGSLEVGKYGDVAMFEGDPFEYTTHVTGVVIDGEVVSDARR
ncbi:amidohydrolase family protein [Aurantiacibacter poecillastricola]|uniref:amidohydrolase family protein n=1 Tax=Aurantiacibacter poecillastricola TaxID=3064385 RepID=UPI00273FBDF6|nr:amidohydrolase family protein [Aurantiacibacter sp. 219JJ12-13]MDP5261229.1 amidohydrolase family protein [Aurantiacibacter sp. 219JJ12-13]